MQALRQEAGELQEHSVACGARVVSTGAELTQLRGELSAFRESHSSAVEGQMNAVLQSEHRVAAAQVSPSPAFLLPPLPSPHLPRDLSPS